VRIIPVIDLKAGNVVRAFRGERAAYAPIETPLAAGSAPGAIVAGFLRLFDFDTIYIADLDAIERCGDHAEAIDALARSFPQISFWVDSGSLMPSAISIMLSAARVSRSMPLPISRMTRARFSRSIFAATLFSGRARFSTMRGSGRRESSP
jgi:uncharacterized protein related to proFAR isomerase